MKPVLLLAALALPAAPAVAATLLVNPVASASVFLPGTVTLAARYRNFAGGAGQEHFLGRNDLGVAGNRIGADATYAAANPFSFALAGTTLTSTIGGSTLSITDAFGFAGAGAQPFDTLQIAVRDGAAGHGTFSLTGLTLSGRTFAGQTVSGVVLPDILVPDFSGISFIAITGLDFRQPFQLTGSFNRFGSFGPSQELNRFEVAIGDGPIEQLVAGIPEPATWAMLIAGFGFVGMSARRRRARVLA
jgi:hypothetical protein